MSQQDISHHTPYCDNEKCETCAKILDVALDSISLADMAFKFYATHGLPIDSINEKIKPIAKNFEYYTEWLNMLIKNHKDKSRRASKFKEAIF